MSKKWSAEDFWQYSLRIYANPDVKNICLKLQNEFSVNVNLLLICGYLNANNRQLSKLQFLNLTKYIAQSVVDVEAVRLQRIEAKLNQPHLYTQMLAQELQLEKRQQQTIVSFLNQQNTSIKYCSNLHVYHSLLDHQGNTDLECMMKELDDIFATNFHLTDIHSIHSVPNANER